jgi:XTP/dITP diphosphohydrolase
VAASLTPLCLATTNRGKIAEIALALEGLPLRLIAASEIANAPAVDEDGRTYEENARKKALAFVAATGLASLADDSGLEIDALDGAPGILSNRFGGEGTPFAEKIRLVLAALDAKPRAPRTARFRCAVVLAAPGRTPVAAEGACEGEIIAAPRGAQGFGYDPIFLVPSLGKTFAELSAEEKQALSHRGIALARMRPALERLAVG